jgi:hypothetical protein
MAGGEWGKTMRRRLRKTESYNWTLHCLLISFPPKLLESYKEQRERNKERLGLLCM